jgi:hypothetical protein
MKKVNLPQIIIIAVTILFLLVQVTPVLSHQTLSSSKMVAAKQTQQKTISPQKIEKPLEYCLPIAAITNCQIVGASGGTVGFAQLQLSWTYAASGVKPYKLLITVYRLQGPAPGTWDNIMPSDQSFEVSSPATTTAATVLIYRLFSGDYRIVFKAYYTCNRVKEYTFERHI